MRHLPKLATRRMMHLLCAACMLGFPVLSATGQSAVAIHSIMTNLPNSPYLGQPVSVSGIVVGVLNSGGYYITAPDAAWDNSPSTAEGIEIYAAAGANPACAIVGNAVTVTGTVANGTAVNGAGTPGTGISPTSCTVTGTGSVAGTISLSSASAYAQDLPFTGMPVANTVFNAVSPTGGTLPDPTTGLVTSTGQFWVDLATPTNGHLFKSAGLEADNFYPPPPAPAKGSSPGIPTWNGNPQRLFVDTATFGGAPTDIGAGQTLTCKAGAGLTTGAINGLGIIDYSLGYNRLLLFKTTSCTVSGSVAPSITSPADSAHFHVGTLNLNNFYGSATPAYSTRLAKSALAIVNVFGKPDILSVQEVQDLATLQAIGDAANGLAGGSTSYQAYWSPPNDATNLGLGFLVNTNTVSVSRIYQVDVNDTFTQLNGTVVPLWERPPYVLEAGLLRAGQNYQVEVVNIETTSRTGIDDPVNGPNVWERRGQQAEDLSVFANAEQNRGQNLLIAGEYNAYSFSDGFVDVTDVVQGNAPPAQGTVAQYEPTVTSPKMYNFVNSITVSNSTYNVIESGNARSIEHVLCSETQNSSASGSIYSYISFVTQPHWTTDFPAIDANDPTIPAGLTPRDGFVGAFLIPPVPTTVSLTPPSVNFGSVYRGNSAAQTLTFTNTSTFPSTVNVSGLAISGTNPADFTVSGGNCTGLIQNASCTITVIFAPTGAGTRSATLTVSSDSGADPTLVANLTGTGLDTTATLSPSAATLPSTQLGAISAAQVFTFTNTSPLPETLTAVFVSGDFIVTPPTCGAIAPSATCSFAVAFQPTAAGNRTGTLTVLNSSTGNPVLTAALTATGLDTTATLTPSAATYPKTATGTTSPAQTFTWMNTSVVPLTINGVTVSGSGDFSAATNTCKGVIAAGTSCTVSVVFSPLSAGLRTGALSIQSTSSANAVLTALLTGTGTSNIAAAPSPLNLGNVDIGATGAPVALVVTNYSLHTIALTSINVAGDYSYTSQCGPVLPGSSQCTVLVTFKPTALGARPGTLTIGTSDPGTPIVTVPLLGSGVDFSIAIAPGSGTVIAGRQMSFAATLTPLGGFSNSVSLQCAIPNNEGGSQCSINGARPLLNATVTSIVTATTTAQYTVIGYTGAGNARSAWLALATGLSALLLFFVRRRRGFQALVLPVLLLALAAANLGCSGKLPDRTADPTYPGTYTYTVTVTDGTLSHNATFNLSVKVN